MSHFRRILYNHVVTDNGVVSIRKQWFLERDDYENESSAPPKIYKLQIPKNPVEESWGNIGGPMCKLR
jgi:hypothetical protein